ncbi:hypothetical protein E1N66_10430 [Pantoea allii]|nr:hypothetical protein E1N66_10430 [Pantoea allii]
MSIGNDIEIKILADVIYNYYKKRNQKASAAQSFKKESDYINVYAHLRNEGFIDSYGYIFESRDKEIFYNLMYLDVKEAISQKVKYMQYRYQGSLFIENVESNDLEEALSVCVAQNKMIFNYNILVFVDLNRIVLKFISGVEMYIDISDEGKLLITFNCSYDTCTDIYKSISFCFEEVIRNLSNIYKVKYKYA